MLEFMDHLPMSARQMTALDENLEYPKVPWHQGESRIFLQRFSAVRCSQIAMVRRKNRATYPTVGRISGQEAVPTGTIHMARILNIYRRPLSSAPNEFAEAGKARMRQGGWDGCDRRHDSGIHGHLQVKWRGWCFFGRR
jgi:hypothetical protein